MKRIILLMALISILVFGGCSSRLDQDMAIPADKDTDVSEAGLEEEEEEKAEKVVPAEHRESEKTCHTNNDCRTGYCVFSECQEEKPQYPVLREVRLYNAGTNNRVRENEDGYYILENGELYYIIAKADNRRNPFFIIAESDKHFGSKGLNENNRRHFKGEEREAVYTSSDVYKVRVSNYEPDHEYPFFFNVLASPRDKFEIKFHIEDFRDSSLTSQEFEFPIFIVSS